ncbi:protein kinase [Streptomyces sp. ISL-1]|uniref:serine/threonine-protein kinase n=1 Tax=Streptomyces sp. ISL-1 TaxID=2817657 RepID=UPI001BE5A0FA|nr:serine/threonine-protein kinase [Streptomyces sp. ISL-1]MBT2392171.1 protein kinase [Streptomyces sp. ISL-1]
MNVPWSNRPDFRLTTHMVGGRYRLDDLLGCGGAADVYEGLDLRLRRPVAVKVFRPESDAHTEERFDDEGRVLAQLQHPGLVTVYDSGQEAGRPYLVMQLIKGATLRRRIAAARLTPAEAAGVGSALASALAHVHAAGVVHRDVKPSNILLGERGTPHLTDFGISRLLDNTTHTATGVLVGTAAYMAPEQVWGRGAGPAADIYSLGLVLLESLKGEREYGGAPLESAIARLHRPPVIPPGLPGDLVELLEAMTAPDENGRPDAHACFRALALVPQGGPPASFPDGAGPVPDDRDAGDDTLRSQWAGARTGGAVPVLAATPSDGPAAPKPISPAPASPRVRRALLTAGAALAVLGVTLSGSIGGLPAEGEDAASRPPRQATTEPTSPRADRPGPSSSPEPAASAPDPLTMSPAAAKEAAAKTSSAADERDTPAAARGKPGTPQSPAVRSPVRDRTELQPMKAKPPKKN